MRWAVCLESLRFPGWLYSVKINACFFFLDWLWALRSFLSSMSLLPACHGFQDMNWNLEQSWILKFYLFSTPCSYPQAYTMLDLLPPSQLPRSDQNNNSYCCPRLRSTPPSSMFTADIADQSMPAHFPTKPTCRYKVPLNPRSRQLLLVNWLCTQDEIYLPSLLVGIVWGRGTLVLHHLSSL